MVWVVMATSGFLLVDVLRQSLPRYVPSPASSNQFESQITLRVVQAAPSYRSRRRRVAITILNDAITACMQPPTTAALSTPHPFFAPFSRLFRAITTAAQARLFMMRFTTAWTL